MKASSTLTLAFNPQHDDLGSNKQLRDGLSVALQIGDSLWLANDESISLERLSLSQDKPGRQYRQAAQHTQFLLQDYLALPVKPPVKSAVKAKKNRKSLKKGKFEEVDIEGLAYADGYLWLAGSHSLKRGKPDMQALDEADKALATVRAEGNRYLLARIPVIENDGVYTLSKQDKHRGNKRTAAQLQGNAKGNDLTRALRKDKHLGKFLAIPGKDNGFDIEGLAVAGDRLFLGLRGPVLRGWAVVLELQLKQDKEDDTRMKLMPMGDKHSLYRKHFLPLNGLGIRDLTMQGEDILILAGPTMQLDGPVSVFRWLRGSMADVHHDKNTCVVTADKMMHLLDVPYGQGLEQGTDHAEGLSLFSHSNGPADSVLIVYDSTAPSRQVGDSSLVADIFMLPRPDSKSRFDSVAKAKSVTKSKSVTKTNAAAPGRKAASAISAATSNVKTAQKVKTAK